MAAPAVSVLLPCFNAARHLPECLESLLNQSFRDYEIVAVDDGSEDETAQLLERAASSRLRLYRQPHQGIASALRAAAGLARAPLLARMDADDIVHPERLALQLRWLEEHPEVDLVASRIEFFPRERLLEGLLRYESWVNSLLTHEEILRDLFVESPLPHPTVMMREAALERAGGYQDCGWPEDYDLWMRMALGRARFTKLPETLVRWRDRPDRASRVDPRYSTESFFALKEHYLLETFLAGKSRIAIWGAGPIGKSWARRLAGRGIEVSHFVEVHPRKIGKYIHGAKVMDASEVGKLRGIFLLAAVGAPGGREEIRRRLASAGFAEGRDFVSVA